ncbi:MAG: hypothetical protein GWO07_05960 [Candidatus Dadabacteria bacterium]|nr:hypothetical protein [Candidatus Dadabacteria bacterium]NIS08300.1 hypothetical protein [Candidatus Dadabacteria bacterium]NIV41648.1 hypothetical protein [Candidatus Dadabacteria bacterium]NIY21819.1 hypothetical protein [Candidatus Dadabacteria bacterium]
MLKITEINNKRNKVELKLEGRIVGTCIDYLEQVCADYYKQKFDEVLLDFSGVRYVESDGVDLLKNLMKNNVKIKSCPIFIEELLKNHI